MTALADFGPLFSVCGCWQIGAAGAIAKVSPEICKTSKELSDASTEAHTKGTLALQYTKDVAAVLQGLQGGGGGGGLDLNTFTQIRELIEEKKARKALAIAREMDDMAENMAKKANHITETLSRSVQELIPENVREDMEGDTTTNTRGIGDDSNAAKDEEASALMELLGHADSDVEEVQANTRSMEQVDIGKAGSTGRDAFFKVAEKEDVAVKIFDEIKTVSNTIVETLGRAGDTSSSLCAQFMAAASTIEALLKALRLSKLIQRALETARRILEAFISFINTSWGKFQNFFDQLDAGKKLEQFTDGIKNSLAGKVGKKIGKVFG